MIHVSSYLSSDDSQPVEDFLTISPSDQSAFQKKFDSITIGSEEHPPSYLPQRLIDFAGNYLVLPISHGGAMTGIMCLGHHDAPSYSNDDLDHARRLLNQVSLALSNAHLVSDLEMLNWGTLEALARTVDAKSKWTAGHSERVAALAVKTARAMGLDEKTIDVIHRAGFLHDIGKIGIPLVILDKPDKLSDEEYERVKEHPLIGAKILEPIEAYSDVIPLILQHHERFDGKGYPHGLRGEEISLGARILAVADVYDALVSSRPYRSGWVEEKVLQLLTEESGGQFDPKIVESFVSAVSWSIDVLLADGKSS